MLRNVQILNSEKLQVNDIEDRSGSLEVVLSPGLFYRTALSSIHGCQHLTLIEIRESRNLSAFSRLL